MTSKADQKRATHETILASAGRLLRARGIAGARVADVMAGARLTVGGFYGHFASKESLIDAALRRAGAEMRARLYERIDTKPVADRALVVLKRYLSAAHRDDVALDLRDARRVRRNGCVVVVLGFDAAERQQTGARQHRDEEQEKAEAAGDARGDAKIEFHDDRLMKRRLKPTALLG